MCNIFQTQSAWYQIRVHTIQKIQFLKPFGNDVILKRFKLETAVGFCYTWVFNPQRIGKAY